MSDTATAPAPASTQSTGPTAPPTIVTQPQGFNDRIKAISQKTTVASEPVVAPPRVEIVRTESTRAQDTPGSRDAAPGTGPTFHERVAAIGVGPHGAPDAPASTDVGPPVGEPANEPAAELSIDDGEMTLAAQRNADGTFKTKLDPNEKVDFTIKSIIDPATGKPKVYTKSLPELARMAKESIVLQQTQVESHKKIAALEPEVEYYRTNVGQWKEHTETLQAQLDAQRALNLELLTSPDELVIQRRQQYAEEMSPAKQLERLKAERAQELEERQKSDQQRAREAQKAQHDRVANRFMSSRIAPALAQAETVMGPEAVTGKVTMLTQDLVQQGVIPPANWPEMEARITSPTGPFQTWLQAESAKRAKESDAVKAAREAAEAEQRRAQAVVNETGRTMVPLGRAGPDSAPAPTPKTDSVQARIDRIVRKPLPDTMQRAG